MNNRDEFINNMASRLEEVRRDVDSVQDDIAQSELTVRISFNRMTSELYGKIKDAEMKLEELKTAGDDNWSELKEKAEETWNELSDSAKKTLEEIKD